MTQSAFPRTPRQTGAEAEARRASEQIAQATAQRAADADNLPPIPEALLVALEARFPLTRPRIGQTMDQIFYASGARAVLELLWAEFDRQQATNNLLTAKILVPRPE